MKSFVQRALFLLATFAVLAVRLGAAELKLHLPLARTAYQCNERIDITVPAWLGPKLVAGDADGRVLALKP